MIPASITSVTDYTLPQHQMGLVVTLLVVALLAVYYVFSTVWCFKEVGRRRRRLGGGWVCDYVYEISVDEMKMRSILVVNLLILFTVWNLYVA
jgi:hypothetical protein